ncbi:MAG TPA: hypothetical protein ENJ95_07755 [Bacteroidetes bacterium]|nr:hypothetical protein [Bacteroidota bacterium]
MPLAIFGQGQGQFKNAIDINFGGYFQSRNEHSINYLRLSKKGFAHSFSATFIPREKDINLPEGVAQQEYTEIVKNGKTWVFLFPTTYDNETSYGEVKPWRQLKKKDYAKPSFIFKGGLQFYFNKKKNLDGFYFPAGIVLGAMNYTHYDYGLKETMLDKVTKGGGGDIWILFVDNTTTVETTYLQERTVKKTEISTGIIGLYTGLGFRKTLSRFTFDMQATGSAVMGFNDSSGSIDRGVVGNGFGKFKFSVGFAF